jgi:hypothetical protein
VDHRNRASRWWRIRARSRTGTDCGLDPDPQARRHPGLFLQIEVTFSLPRQLWWLLAGIAIGHVLLPDGLLEKATLILRALLPG